MEAHYKISALCLSIRVTERGLVAVPCHSELSTCRLTQQGPQGFCWRRREGNKTSRDVIKVLHLQCLDISGTSGLHTLQGWAIAPRESSISHIRRQALPEGFIYKTGRENCPEEGEISDLSLSGTRECKYTTNKFLPEHNGGLGRQEDEMRKEDGGR